MGDIVDGNRKAELLKFLAQVENIELDQVIAVGDGANDLPMLNIAGLGIAFHAKPKVKRKCQTIYLINRFRRGFILFRI